ncbi:hypothetical protein B0H19DRAFT_1084946 [Mycena capillaripes]|nr:hypothetical protein B0H19DRAFT_1084946 [Mycena capillaripes]
MSVAHARRAPQPRDFVCPARDPLGGTLLTSHSGFVDTTNKFVCKYQGGNPQNITLPCYYSPTNGTFVAGSGYCPPQLEGTPPPPTGTSQEPSSFQSFAPSQSFAPTQSFSLSQSFAPTQSTTPQSAAQKLIPSESAALSSTTDTSVPMQRKQMTSGTIAGIVLGLLLTVTIMMLVTFLVRKRRHRGRAQATLKPEGHPYLNPFYETLSSSQVVTSSDALSAGLGTPVTTEARRHDAPAALKGAVPQPSAPYHEEENPSTRQQNDDLHARVRTLEMQLQSPSNYRVLSARDGNRVEDLQDIIHIFFHKYNGAELAHDNPQEFFQKYSLQICTAEDAVQSNKACFGVSTAFKQKRQSAISQRQAGSALDRGSWPREDESGGVRRLVGGSRRATEEEVKRTGEVNPMDELGNALASIAIVRYHYQDIDHGTEIPENQGTLTFSEVIAVAKKE